MIRARFVLPALLVFALSAPAFAQTSVAGDWDITIDSPQGSRTVAMSLKQDGEKLDGLFKSQMGELPLAGTLTGSDLKLTFTLNMGGTPLDVVMTGKVEGEGFGGKADFGGMAEGTFSAKRAAAATATTVAAAPAAAPASSPAAAAVAGTVSGTWDVVLKTGAGDFPVTAMLTEDGGKVAGTLQTQMGDANVTGTHEGNALKLSFVAKTPQGDIPISLSADIDGDALVNGKAEFGGMGQGEWSAKRKQ